MNDNGGTEGVKVFNAGMRGMKVTPWMGGTRAASFWRWPGTLTPGDVHRLAAHIDVFPTLAEISGAKLSDEVRAQVEGRSLTALLHDPNADWPDRKLFTHVGRWPKGAKPADYKYAHCCVRSASWRLVCDSKDRKKKWQLFEILKDPGEKADVAGKHPAVVQEMDAAYDAWWDSVQPYLVNENAVGPKVNPFKELYYKQFGGSPEQSGPGSNE
jgi:arylsulfatase